MAKYEPIEMVKKWHGKICGHSDVYFAAKGDTLYSGKICNPRTSEPSADELAARNMFKQAIENVKALSEAEQTAYATAYASYTRGYKTLRGYMFAQEYAKLKAAAAGE